KIQGGLEQATVRPGLADPTPPPGSSRGDPEMGTTAGNPHLLRFPADQAGAVGAGGADTGLRAGSRSRSPAHPSGSSSFGPRAERRSVATSDPALGPPDVGRNRRRASSARRDPPGGLRSLASSRDRRPHGVGPAAAAHLAWPFLPG